MDNLNKLTEKEAARLVLQYYHQLDGDQQSDDYEAKVCAARQTCVEAFSEAFQGTNRVASLFMVRHHLDVCSSVLFDVGSEVGREYLVHVYNFVDANLRIIIERLTGYALNSVTHITIEEKFVHQFSPHDDKLIFPNFRKDSKK